MRAALARAGAAATCRVVAWTAGPIWRLAARMLPRLEFRGFVGSIRQLTAILPNPHTLRHPDWGALVARDTGSVLAETWRSNPETRSVVLDKGRLCF